MGAACAFAARGDRPTAQRIPCRVIDATWDALCAHLDEVELIELCMLVGHYEMLAMTLESIGVARDVSRRASER